MIIKTDRLTLRALTLADVDALHAVLGDPVAMRFYPAPFSRRETQEWIERNLQRYQELGFGLWALIRANDDRLIGDCGLTIQQVDGQPEEEIGYHVLRECWGQGYAAEAAAAVRDHQFQVRGKDRVISWMSPDNLASRRVAEKVGMHFEKWSTNRHGGAMVVYHMKALVMTPALPPAETRSARPGSPPGPGFSA
jgi:RimJ/RimL family protein N-acetyltransferase